MPPIAQVPIISSLEKPIISLVGASISNSAISEKSILIGRAESIAIPLLANVLCTVL